MTVSLNQSSLTQLPAAVGYPKYARDQLTAGIVHVGIGNFHRSHQGVYLNDLLNGGGDPTWAIRGAGVRQPDAQMRQLLSEQDWLYSVVEVDHENYKADIVGAMIDFVEVAPKGNAPLIAAMANPDTKIVSLTVTEGGYFVDASTGTFDVTHPDIAADIANPKAPNTVFGAILAGLAARRAEKAAAFTVMSCDNLPGNGDVARAAIMEMARALDPDLAKWVEDHVSFPNGMVDRITPATGARERELLQSKFGIKDNFPVFCEPFRQCVLEDKFVNGRPDFEQVGVTLTDDIHAFERMKIRLLNGGHAILAYPAALMGIEFVHDAMGNDLVRSYLRKVLSQDVAQHVDPVPGFTPAQYLDSICKRFENPGVADTTSRLCHDGSNRQPKFIIPSIRDGLKFGYIPDGLALSSALWCHYCKGQTDAGTTIADNDPDWANLQKAAQRASSDPKAWLSQEDIYGDVGRDDGFIAAFSATLRSVEDKGTEETLKTYLS